MELDHDFRLCDENEGQMALENVLEEVLERRYEMLTPGDDFELLVNTMSNGRDDSRLAQIVVVCTFVPLISDRNLHFESLF